MKARKPLDHGRDPKIPLSVFLLAGVAFIILLVLIIGVAVISGYIHQSQP